MTTTVLTRRALGRAVLARQLLLHPARMTALQAIEHLVGLQAQVPSAPYYGLWSRLAAFDPLELSGLIDSRGAVRIALMRSTVHLVSAADCLALRPLMQPAVGKALSAGHPWARELAEIDRGELARIARKAVEQSPSTNGELEQVLRPSFPELTIGAMAAGVRTDLALVQVPPRGLWRTGGMPRCTTAEHWLGRSLDPNPDPATVVLRYLRAFGPASVRDFQNWSGLTRFAAVFGSLRYQLVCFRDENGVELFDLPDAPRPDPDTPAPVVLLAEFDNLLLSHADRTRVVDADTAKRIFMGNGMIRGAVLIDGIAAGAWKLRTTAKSATVQVEPMSSWTRRDRAAIEERAAAAAAFTDPSAAFELEYMQ